MRMVRLTLGIAVMFEALMQNEWIFFIAGSVLSLLALFNISYCAATNCELPARKRMAKSQEHLSFEEIK